MTPKAGDPGSKVAGNLGVCDQRINIAVNVYTELSQQHGVDVECQRPRNSRAQDDERKNGPLQLSLSVADATEESGDVAHKVRLVVWQIFFAFNWWVNPVVANMNVESAVTAGETARARAVIAMQADNG